MQMPDFRSAEWQEAATDEGIAAVIERGRGMMPAFGDRVPEQGIRALVTHVRTLRAAAAPAASTAPAPTTPAPAPASPEPAAPTE